MRKRKLKPDYDRLWIRALSPAQRALAEKHGTPAEFAAAVYRAVPGDISMDEARAAIDKYNLEWKNAK